jgi:Flp pilus assembly protein TadB
MSKLTKQCHSSNVDNLKRDVSGLRQSVKQLRLLTLCVFVPVTVISIIYLLVS